MKPLTLFSFSLMSLVLFAISGFAQSQQFTPSPSHAPAPAPSSDGASLDQGIAYLLMLVALAITYMFH
ncbi:hypothetical protein PIB30_030623 [Stylosanthes scabra]|uniref:Uncharacterized protein n=1 Tax=Stylosanthes scabra TaxID=79078 RepID=A0ABU6X9E5_9FABA|nr:hypothetical protein [Stylosanthes scabra]